MIVPPLPPNGVDVTINMMGDDVDYSIDNSNFISCLGRMFWLIRCLMANSRIAQHRRVTRSLTGSLALSLTAHCSLAHCSLHTGSLLTAHWLTAHCSLKIIS